MASLDITGILRSVGAGVEFSEKLCLEPMYLMGDKIIFDEPVRVCGSVVNNDGDTFVLKAKAEGEYNARCSRCGNDIKEKFSLDIEEVMYHNPVRTKHALSDKEIGEYMYKAEKEGALVFTSHLIDLDEIVSNEIFASLPMHFLCSEECKGLCPVCGMNLNEGQCDCLK